MKKESQRALNRNKRTQIKQWCKMARGVKAKKA